MKSFAGLLRMLLSGVPPARLNCPGRSSPESRCAATRESDSKSDELKQIRASVASIRRTGDGMIIVTLEKGHAWQ